MNADFRTATLLFYRKAYFVFQAQHEYWGMFYFYVDDEIWPDIIHTINLN